MGRPYESPPLLRDQPRAIWYVLDEDGADLPAIRAERGPGNRSWVRKKTRDVLDKLFRDERLQTSDGLFISPFVAQAKDIASYLVAVQRSGVVWAPDVSYTGRHEQSAPDS